MLPCAVGFCEPGGTVITDCKAVFKKWYSIRLGRSGAVGDAVAGSCWHRLAEALSARPDVHCNWMPSHLTMQELVARGFPARWQAGNAQADALAQQADSGTKLPEHRLHKYRFNQDVAAKVAATRAANELKRL